MFKLDNFAFNEQVFFTSSKLLHHPISANMIKNYKYWLSFAFFG